MFSGFPLGAAFGGFLAAWMIPQWGWRRVLMLGGMASLILTVLLLVLLQKSVRYIVARKEPVQRHPCRASPHLRLCPPMRLPSSSSEKATMAQPEGKSGIGVVL